MPSAISAALAALSAARPAYDEAAAMYEGTAEEVFASDRLRQELSDNADVYTINYARTPVDVLVERTMIQGWTCKDAQQLATINRAWEDNELGLEAKDVHRRAYEYGDAYLIGWAREGGGVTAYAHDPDDVRVFYDPSEPRRKKLAVHTWLEQGDDENGLGDDGFFQRIDLYFPDHLERYVSRQSVLAIDGSSTGATNQRDEDFEDYEGDGDDSLIFYADEGLPDVIPVFHFRTARPYGRPEHADAYGPQRGITKLVASMMGAVDYHVLPQRYATTESAIDQQLPPGDDLFAGTADETPTTTTDQGGDIFGAGSDMESAPGAVWLLSGGKVNVGEFSAANMENFLKPKNDFVDSMAAVTDLPLDRFRPAAGQAPSGEARRMAEIPLNKKTSDRFMQFGVTWREFASWVIAVEANAETVEKVDAVVAWAPPETYSDQASWETAEAQLRVGVPYEQVLKERGYSGDVVKQWADERAAALAAAAAKPVKDEPAANPAVEG